MTARDTAQDRGAAIVVQPDEGESYWQPVPANGYAEVRVSSRDDPSINSFSSGIQIIAPGGRIREHQHGANEELLFFFEGRGRAVIDGVEHPIVPGTTVYVGPWRKHTFINDGEGDLKMFWVLAPGGLEDFFQAIGRPRTPGEPAPAPFPRPDDVERIETGTVFASLAEGPGPEPKP
ncbi:MAG: cupin domain-containing protein [Proteobacteria bacterium]|nr:cupin domain-containing protein [Pseudomonadota bacterium]